MSAPVTRAERDRAALPEPDDDDGSFATENSDEDPLEGEPAEHVEAMLSSCLDPDERQCFGDEVENDEDDEGDDAGSRDDHVDGGEAAHEGGEATAGPDGQAGRGDEPDSEAEEADTA